jgi:hypothetical protein
MFAVCGYKMSLTFVQVRRYVHCSAMDGCVYNLATLITIMRF